MHQTMSLRDGESVAITADRESLLSWLAGQTDRRVTLATVLLHRGTTVEAVSNAAVEAHRVRRGPANR